MEPISISNQTNYEVWSLYLLSISISNLSILINFLASSLASRIRSKHTPGQILCHFQRSKVVTIQPGSKRGGLGRTCIWGLSIAFRSCGRWSAAAPAGSGSRTSSLACRSSRSLVTGMTTCRLGSLLHCLRWSFWPRTRMFRSGRSCFILRVVPHRRLR